MKPKEKGKKTKFYLSKNFYLLLIVLASLFMSIGYATVNSVSLDFTGEASIKSSPGIYVYNAQIGTGTNGTNPDNSRITMLYNDVMKSVISLGSNTNSTLTVNITMYNTLSYPTIFTGITYSENFYSNNNITYDLNGISVGTVLPANSSTSFTMTFRYTGNDTSNNILTSYLKFNFKKFYTITYQNIDTTNKNYPTYILDEESSKTVTFTGDIPYDVNISPSVSYTYNSPTLTLNNVKNNITINRYYSITYHLDGGTNAQNNPTRYLHGASETIHDATKTDFIFDGWYDNSSFTGSAITSTTGLSGNLNLYAKWINNLSPYRSVTQLALGDTVIYEMANGNDVECKVLYDSSSSYGIQIVAMSTLENVSLGNGSTSLSGVKYSSNQTYYNTAKDGYNNARSKLNTRARTYVNTDLSPANGARVIGTPPDNPDVANIERTSGTPSYLNNQGFNDIDTYYTTDLNQMNLSSVNAAAISTNYWMGSNYFYATNSLTSLYVRMVMANATTITNSSTGTYANNNRCLTYRSNGLNNSQSFGNSQGLRPVFTLKNTIYYDSSSTPYRLSATN